MVIQKLYFKNNINFIKILFSLNKFLHDIYNYATTRSVIWFKAYVIGSNGTAVKSRSNPKCIGLHCVMELFQINMSTFSTRDIISRHHKTGTQWSQPIFQRFLFSDTQVYNLLFELCTRLFKYKCGEKHVPDLCLWFLGVFTKIPWSIFTY